MKHIYLLASVALIQSSAFAGPCPDLDAHYQCTGNTKEFSTELELRHTGPEDKRVYELPYVPANPDAREVYRYVADSKSRIVDAGGVFKGMKATKTAFARLRRRW